MTIEPPRQMAERLERQLQRLSPGHPVLLLPFDGFKCDLLEDAIRECEAAKAAAQPQQDTLTKKQQEKRRELLQRIHETWMRWRESLNECRKIAHAKSQQIMRLLPVGWDEDKFDTPLRVSDGITYSSFEHGRRENERLEMHLWHIESRVAAMTAALAFANETPAEQAKQMVYMIADDFMDLVERVKKLEQALRDVTPKPKPKLRKVS
jgi:hypothetical protein